MRKTERYREDLRERRVTERQRGFLQVRKCRKRNYILIDYILIVLINCVN